MFEEEISRLRLMMQRSRARLEERRRERDGLKSENSALMRSFMSSVSQLSEARGVMAGLELRESELRSKMVGLEYLRIKIEELERRLREEKPRPSTWHQQRFVENMTKVNWDFGMDAINIGKSSMDQRTLDLIIKIRTEYLAIMKMKLEEVRRTYTVKYEEFILSVEKSASEVERKRERELVLFYSECHHRSCGCTRTSSERGQPRAPTTSTPCWRWRGRETTG